MAFARILDEDTVVKGNSQVVRCKEKSGNETNETAEEEQRLHVPTSDHFQHVGKEVSSLIPNSDAEIPFLTCSARETRRRTEFQQESIHTRTDKRHSIGTSLVTRKTTPSCCAYAPALYFRR